MGIIAILVKLFHPCFLCYLIYNQTMKKRFLGWSTLLLLVGAAFLPLSSCVARGFIFPGTVRENAYYGVLFKPQEVVEIAAEDGTVLRGWFLNRGSQAPLVVMYGGNAMNVAGFHDLARADKARSYLLMNYRGYGASDGSPSQDAIVADSVQCIDWAQHQLCSSPELVLVGYSIGSGVAMQVAAKAQPSKVVLMCPFDSVESVAREAFGGFGAWMVRNDAFLSTEVARDLTCPVTIFAGRKDDIITPKHTQALAEAFTKIEPRVIWMDCGHLDLMSAPGFRFQFEQALK